MGLFDKFKKKNTAKYRDDEIVAIANGEMIPASEISDPVFAKELMGRTIGFCLVDGEIVSPVNGTVEVMFPTSHAFEVRMADGTGILVHVGAETVSVDAKGFKALVKEGAAVNAGEKVIEADLDVLHAAGMDAMAVLIITEGEKGKLENVI